MTKKLVTVEQILFNEPYELQIEGWGIVKVRDPKVKDRREAYKLASQHPCWEQMSDLEKAVETTRFLMIKCLVEPKITPEQYLEANEIKIAFLLDKIADEMSKRMENITRKGLQHFLPEKTE